MWAVPCACAASGPSAKAAEEARSALGAKALGLLHKAMVHEDSEVRVMAAEQWGPIGNPAAKSVLQRALKDPSAYVRIAAAGSLLELSDPSGVKAVEAVVLESPGPAAAEGALGALEEMRSIARNKTRAWAIQALAGMKVPETLPTLRKAAEDPDAAVRDAAAAGLARLGDSAAMGRLSSALASQDPALRTKAVEALSGVGTPAVVALLKPLAEDTVYQVRAAVMGALGESGSPLVLPELLGGVKDQNELVRSKAVAALGRLGVPGAVQYLEKAKRQASNVYIELLAVAGLARLGETVDLAPARRALYQPDADTRLLAVEVLEAAAGRAIAGADQAAEKAALEDLETALDDAEMRVRVRAAAALVRVLQKTPKRPSR
ncbi:MAG: HEAT repeat domain-containing protein [Elusimicrobia bacterium]|nr:HEAT repeat domain-containing protein [Elusimicrobiota bacterium]